MSQFIVEGGHPIGGEITPAGNKNEALPVIAASLIATEPVILQNLPRIGDVLCMLEIIERLGAKIDWLESNTLQIDARSLQNHVPDAQLSSGIRASFLLAGPLLAKMGRVSLPRPGGDRIGRRRIDTHLLALSALGAKIEVTEQYDLHVEGGFVGCELFLDEASVMATENALIAASTSKTETVIYNAACEPHVQGLCNMLQALGAHIEGIGTNMLRVQGGNLQGGITHRIGPDHIEIGSLVGLSAVTGGELCIKDIRKRDLRKILMDFRRLGVRTRFAGSDLIVPKDQSMEVQADLGGAIPKIDDGPWPGFPADLTSIALVIATQSQGTVLIHEKMFESRLFFVDRLIFMGARIVLCDPHRAVVVGPADLSAATLVSPDIRAGMALLLAALTAKGKSTILNVEQIDRGYEQIEQRLRAMGAHIKRV